MRGKDAGSVYLRKTYSDVALTPHAECFTAFPQVFHRMSFQRLRRDRRVFREGLPGTIRHPGAPSRTLKRETWVETRYYPETGTVERIRLDTGEILSRRPVNLADLWDLD
jgi:hypothetical protein